MKKIISTIVIVGALWLPVLGQVPDKCDSNINPVKCPLLDTTNAVVRVVKFPFVLTAVSLGKLTNNGVQATLKQSWQITGEK
mgnify:CR=1 FL=1